jgi:hypothetical protein
MAVWFILNGTRKSKMEILVDVIDVVTGRQKVAPFDRSRLSKLIESWPRPLPGWAVRRLPASMGLRTGWGFSGGSRWRLHALQNSRSSKTALDK